MFSLNHWAHPSLELLFACTLPLWAHVSHSQPVETLWICMKSLALPVTAAPSLLLLLQQHTYYAVLIRFLGVIITTVSWYSIAKGWCSARSRKLPSGYRKCSDRSLLLFWVSSGERWSERRGARKDRERLSPGEIKWGQERTQIMHEREQKSGREQKRSQIRLWEPYAWRASSREKIRERDVNGEGDIGVEVDQSCDKAVY